MVRPWLHERGRAPERAVHTLSPRGDKWAIAKLARRGFGGPCPPSRSSLDTAPTSAADRALTARHVGVAAFPVKNRPETGKRTRRSFPAAAGWFFRPRPHAEEHRSANGSTNAPAASERCDASRSMRATVLILRDARTRVRLCGSACACALLRMRTAELAAGRRTAFGNSQLTMSNSPSRSRGACLRPGFATSLHSPRVEGGRSAERRSGARRNTRGRAHNAARQALARRLASHDAGRSPLGAPPWRFFTRGRASVSGMTRIRTASSSQPGRSAWRATSRASRGQRLQVAAAGRHASLRIQDRL